MMWALWVAGVAWATPDASADGVEHAVRAELDRALTLRLEGSPAPYHLRAKIVWADQIEVEASMGALVRARRSPEHGLGVEVRVGSPAYDNTGFGGWRDGFSSVGLTAEPSPLVAQLDGWRVLDRAYKDAVEQYSRKQAQAVLPPDHPGDFLLVGPYTHVDAASAFGPEAQQRLTDLAIQTSAVFAAHPALDIGSVFIGAEQGWQSVIDTQGTHVRRTVDEVTVRAVAHALSADGLRLTDQRLWTVRSVDALPPAHAMVTEIKAMVATLEAALQAPLLDEEYVGPVLFEDAAAADVMRWLLLPQLEGTPPEVPFDSFIGEIGGAPTSVRLRRRVLPSGWKVWDDPQALPAHPGAYAFDDEGTPTRAVHPVDDGVVVDLFRTRVPREEGDTSNGHARGTLYGRALGKASLTEVQAPRRLGLSALHRRALRAASAYGLDYVMVVRRFQHPGLRNLADPFSGFDEPSSLLPPPTWLVRLFADGREEIVRGGRFAAVDRRILRDIMAAGPVVSHTYLSAWDGDDADLGPTEGAPCRMVAPMLLVDEVEIVPYPPDPKSIRRLAPPTVHPDTAQEASP